MSIDVTNQHAEQSLLNNLNKNGENWGALHLNCAKVGFEPDQIRVDLAIRTSLGEKQTQLYFLEDGDIVILWDGADKNVADGLRKSLQECLHIVLDAKLDHYYAAPQDTQTLLAICRDKVANLENVRAEIAKKLLDAVLICTAQQRDEFYQASYSRKFRSHPTVLLVEDQAFSLELLRNILTGKYKAYACSNARAAWNVYLEHAPDIVLLDIELPDIDGHQLAAAIAELDPQAHVVMVTANNYAQDVEKAKANNAKGFIIKPYNKQKILDSIEKFEAKRNPKRKHTG